MKREHLLRLRDLIRQAATSLPDEDALDGVELFPTWAVGMDYSYGIRLRYGDKLYRCVQGHRSQADWTPDATPALWTEVAKPGEIPVWRQPTGAQDAYQTGDLVHYPDEAGSVWRSTVDNNVWQPGVYGWEEE
jgi:hypothetical protein